MSMRWLGALVLVLACTDGRDDDVEQRPFVAGQRLAVVESGKDYAQIHIQA